jgi:hypothetical protein
MNNLLIQTYKQHELLRLMENTHFVDSDNLNLKL